MEAFAADALSTERTIFGDTAQSDTLDANITTDFLRGWGLVGVNENPTKQDFNGLGFTLGQLIAYLHQRGIAEWNTAQEYFDGSVVTTDVGIYRLKVGGDGSSDPDTDGGSNWELVNRGDQDLSGKADKATTYTKTAVDEMLDDKAAISGQAFSGDISAPNLSGTNTGDQDLSAKADQDTTYTKTEVDDLLDDKAAISGQAFSGDISAPNLSGTNTGDQVLSEFGVGQTWQSVSRGHNVTYTNSTGKPITAAVSVRDADHITVTPANAYVDATLVIRLRDVLEGGASFTFIIPAGSTYKVTFSPNTLQSWVELR